jgi:phosphomannomutase/phosphoglucomutase
MYGVHQYVRDGAMATALMLEYLAYSGLTLHQLYDKLPKMYVVKTKVSVDPRDKDLIFEKLKIKLLEVFSGGRVIDIDGIKFITSDYWFLVRPSGTEPLIRIYVEARDEVLANKVLNNILTLANEVSMR